MLGIDVRHTHNGMWLVHQCRFHPPPMKGVVDYGATLVTLPTQHLIKSYANTIALLAHMNLHIKSSINLSVLQFYELFARVNIYIYIEKSVLFTDV